MIGTLTRITLVTAALAGLSGTAFARDSSGSVKNGAMRMTKGFKPAYQANTNVAGTAQPYTWPVSDRYRPVSQPYFGKTY